MSIAAPEQAEHNLGGAVQPCSMYTCPRADGSCSPCPWFSMCAARSSKHWSAILQPKHDRLHLARRLIAQDTVLCLEQTHCAMLGAVGVSISMYHC